MAQLVTRKRLPDRLAAVFLGLVFAAYAGYAALIGYFNDWEFFFTPGLNASSTELDTLRLDVSPDKVRLLNRNIWPQETRKYESIHGLEINGRRFKAKIKSRGYEKHHFGSDLNSRRRSWRIQLKDGDRYRGMKTFNLRRLEFPTYLHGHLPYLLTEKLGLFALKADLVAVYWNETYYGVMALWEQLGNGFLKRRGKPKGLIFGESVSQGLHDLWTHPGEYGKENERWKTYPDSDPDGRWDPLRKLLRILQDDDDETFRREIREILDVDQFVEAVAFWNLGGSFHQDSHNIRLYYNPKRKKFEWILWDIAGFHYTVRRFSYEIGQEQDFRLDWCPNPVMHRLFKEPEIVEKRNQILWGWMQNEITRDAFKELIDREAARAAPYVKAENNRLYAWRYFKNSVRRFKKWVDFRYDFITNELNNTRVSYELKEKSLVVTVEGQSGFRPQKMKADAADKLTVVWDRNRNGVSDAGDAVLKTRSEGGEIIFSEPPLLLPARRDIPKPYPNPHFSEWSLAPAPADYSFLLLGPDGMPKDAAAVTLLEGINSTTGRSILAENHK